MEVLAGTGQFGQEDVFTDKEQEQHHQGDLHVARQEFSSHPRLRPLVWLRLGFLLHCVPMLAGPRSDKAPLAGSKLPSCRHGRALQPYVAVPTHGKRRPPGRTPGHHRHLGCGGRPAAGPQCGTHPVPLGPAHDRPLRGDRLLPHAAVHARHPVHEAAPPHEPRRGRVAGVPARAGRLRRFDLPVRRAAGDERDAFRQFHPQPR